MREALRGLTTRGRSFLAAGAAAAVSAFILGERDLLRVAVLLAVLPLLAAAYVGRSRYKLGCTRARDPGDAPGRDCRGPQPVQAGLPAVARPGPGPGRLERPRHPAPAEPLPAAHRHAA